MVRSRWLFIYTGFYLLTTAALLALSGDIAKVIISMTNVVIVLTPLIGILLGTTYYYNSKEFIQLLLAQALSRWSIFSGVYSGMGVALCASAVIGIGLPFLFFGIGASPDLSAYLILIGVACVLSVIFSLIAFLVAMRFDDKVKGLSISLFIWLFFAVLYDGLFLLLLLAFKEYPLDNLTLSMVVLNPIDLARILILLNLDLSAMMGYTGAVLSQFFGKGPGMLFIVFTLLMWVLVPLWRLRALGQRKDF